mmetsp:Transcript_12936/g.35154  ORF Transcript_12936/g.35154 Transcript_12936/m.35154 type:complete len:226 (+) Transcript_12936:939-1616(+)
MTTSNSPRLNGKVMCKKCCEKSTTFQTISKSMKALSTTPGCCTFTATSRSFPPGPSKANSGRSRARWTCPTEPLATGSSSKLSNISATSRPNWSRNVSLETEVGWLGASDLSLLKVSMTSGGNMSGLMESHWPNFWNAAPAFWVQFSICANQSSRHAGLSEKIIKHVDAATNGANTHARYNDLLIANQAFLYHGQTSYGCTKTDGSGTSANSTSSSSLSASSILQ